MFKYFFLVVGAMQLHAESVESVEHQTIATEAGVYPLELFELSPQARERVFSRRLGEEIERFSARLPARSFDIRHRMSAVQDQQARSSCSAFQAIGLAEQSIGPMSNLSEQCLIYHSTRVDWGSTESRLKFIVDNGAYREESCPYVSPDSYANWHLADEHTRQQLAQNALNTIPNLNGKQKVFLSAQIVSSNVDSLGATESINYIRNKILADIPVGVSTLVAGRGWERGLIDKIPTEKELATMCPPQANADSAKKNCRGHAVIITGFDDHRGVFFFKNSWSDNWGVNAQYYPESSMKRRTGYGVMSYAYFARFAIGNLLTLEQV